MKIFETLLRKLTSVTQVSQIFSQIWNLVSCLTCWCSRQAPPRAAAGGWRRRRRGRGWRRPRARTGRGWLAPAPARRRLELANDPSVFTKTVKASTRAFSWLKVQTRAFTFKTLLRHYAKQPFSFQPGEGPSRGLPCDYEPSDGPFWSTTGNRALGNAFVRPPRKFVRS